MEKTVIKSSTFNKNRREAALRSVKRNWVLYLFVLPLLVYFIMFHIIPLYGLQIAFQNFKPAKGFSGSAWVGLKYFEKFVTSLNFWQLMRNTLTLSLYSLLLNFPFAILLALVINYTPCMKLKKLTQTVSYAPHFVSTVVLVGMLNVFLMPGSGVVNALLGKIGVGPVNFLGDSSLFPHVYAWSGLWSHCGYNAILYIAALTSISPELHEAATVDGANKLQRIWHIDLPAIAPTAITLLIMNCGNILNVGFEKAYLMQAASNLPTSEIISTYVYKIGLLNTQYSYAAAIGMFNNVINCIVLLIVNYIADKTSGSGLW